MALTQEQQDRVETLRAYRNELESVKSKLTAQGGVTAASVTDPIGTTRTYSRMDLSRLRREIGHVNQEINTIRRSDPELPNNDPIFGRATRFRLI